MSSILVIGGEDPVGAQLAMRLRRIGHDVAATVSVERHSERVVQALSHRGVEVYLCNPDDPLSISPAVAGRDELYLCLRPEAAPPQLSRATLTPVGWRGLGPQLGELLLALSRAHPSGEPDPFRSHEVARRSGADELKSPLRLALESCALSSSTAPKVTLLCSMFALAPQLKSLDSMSSEGQEALYSEPPLEQLSKAQRLLRALRRLLLPEPSPSALCWRRAHLALSEAKALSLTSVLYALPYHERRLLSGYDTLELLSSLSPSLISCVPLEDLTTGIIQLRAYDEKRGAPSGRWYLGGDNLKASLIEETLSVELTAAQRSALSTLERGAVDEGRWTLSSSRAQQTLNYEWRLRRHSTDERRIPET